MLTKGLSAALGCWCRTVHAAALGAPTWSCVLCQTRRCKDPPEAHAWRCMCARTRSAHATCELYVAGSGTRPRRLTLQSMAAHASEGAHASTHHKHLILPNISSPGVPGPAAAAANVLLLGLLPPHHHHHRYHHHQAGHLLHGQLQGQLRLYSQRRLQQVRGAGWLKAATFVPGRVHCWLCCVVKYTLQQSSSGYPNQEPI